jgi:hypothetical protein
MTMPRDEVNANEGGEDVVRLQNVLNGSWMLNMVVCFKILAHFVKGNYFLSQWKKSWWYQVNRNTRGFGQAC